MLFPSIDFAIFICAVFPLAWLLMPRREGRSLLPWKLFMIGASYVFYAWWDPALLWLLALVTVLAQGGATAISRWKTTVGSRWALGTSILLILTPLLWFKYYGWIAETSERAFGLVGWGSPLPLMQILLPVGISFYTFMAISYVVDVYRGEAEPAGWVDATLYLCFFPHLVAGPIVRANELVPQFATSRNADDIDEGHAARLIFRGLFKKVVVSSFLATSLVDPVFGDPGAASSLDVLVAIYGYAIVIYSDFSGYTDIAIGIAELHGFRFPANFDAPYTATSLQDFWRRWHITLSRWLRDYLYIPLGGSRGSTLKTSRNIMLTMVLGGIWHGAGWTFVAWGAIHGLGQVAGHIKRSRWPQTSARWWRTLGARAITFHLVCLAWVFFRAASIEDALTLLGQLGAGLSTDPVLVSPLALAVIAGALGMQYWRLVPRLPSLADGAWDRFGKLDPLSRGVVAGLILFAITTLGPEGVAPFIYFRF